MASVSITKISGAVTGPHVSRRVAIDNILKMYASRKPHTHAVHSCEVIPEVGGCGTVGFKIHSSKPGLRISALIAGNSGRPGGSVGNFGGGLNQNSVNSHHRTQEEDMVSNWLLTQYHDRASRAKVFDATLSRRWGFELNSKGTMTIQGVDYTVTTKPLDYGDAWTVLNTRLCAKSPRGFHAAQSFPAHLVFVAGPNAGARGSKNGSMTRTLNQHTSKDYTLFRACVLETVRSGLDAMAMLETDVALLAMISCGIYAGPHRRRIAKEFPQLVEQLLKEKVTDTHSRGHFFQRVVIPMLR